MFASTLGCGGQLVLQHALGRRLGAALAGCLRAVQPPVEGYPAGEPSQGLPLFALCFLVPDPYV